MYTYIIHCRDYIPSAYIHMCTHTHTQERSVQSDAGGLLGEVKRKLNDMQHYLKLVASLKELREHRREAHRKAGGLHIYIYTVPA